MHRLTGERIEQLRTGHGLTKQALADKLAMRSYSSITHWENGQNLPRGSEVIKMAKMFNVSTDYLYGLTDKKRWD